jgi:hypothetical protein
MTVEFSPCSISFVRLVPCGTGRFPPKFMMGLVPLWFAGRLIAGYQSEHMHQGI